MHWILMATLFQAGPPEEGSRPRADESLLSLGLHGRVMGVAGDATSSSIAYGDLFHSGYGASLDGDWLWEADSWAYGFTASLGFDRLQGRRFSDDLGDSVRPEALDLATLSLGGKLDLFLDEPFFRGQKILAQVFAGAGAVWYEGVDATFTIAGTSTEAELFASTVAPMADLGFRVGVAGRTFAFTLGLRVRWQGGPDRGDDASATVDPEGFTAVGFELGWDIRF